MTMLNEALRVIEAQQKEVKEFSAPWMVGEQLKDICRAEPAAAELILQDLSVKEMSITEAEKKIAAFAKGHKVGNCGCVTPVQADEILRKFYGLPKRGESAHAPEPARPARKVLDLSDFM